MPMRFTTAMVIGTMLLTEGQAFDRDVYSLPVTARMTMEILMTMMKLQIYIAMIGERFELDWYLETKEEIRPL